MSELFHPLKFYTRTHYETDADIELIFGNSLLKISGYHSKRNKVIFQCSGTLSMLGTEHPLLYAEETIDIEEVSFTCPDKGLALNFPELEVLNQSKIRMYWLAFDEGW